MTWLHETGHAAMQEIWERGIGTELMPSEATTIPATQLLQQPSKPDAVPLPIRKKSYLRVIDDTTLPMEQNVVIPYPVKDLP